MPRHLALVLPALFIAFACTAAGAHPFYVTICQIDHNPESESLEITFKFFTDDLERGLRGSFGADVRLVRGKTPDAADPHVIAYVTRKFSLTAGETRLELDYVGKEVGLDTTFVYFEAKQVPTVVKLSVRSTILLELFEDHDTIVHIRVGTTEKSLLLRKDSDTGTLELEP